MYFEPKILNIHYWVWDSSVGGYEFRCEATCTASDLLPLSSLHRPAITCDLSVWTWKPMKCCIICKFFGCSPLTMQSYEVSLSSPQVVHRGTVPTAVIRYDLRVYNMVYTRLIVRYPFLVFITFIQNRWSRMYSRVFDVVITLLVFLGLLTHLDLTMGYGIFFPYSPFPQLRQRLALRNSNSNNSRNSNSHSNRKSHNHHRLSHSCWNRFGSWECEWWALQPSKPSQVQLLSRRVWIESPAFQVGQTKQWGIYSFQNCSCGSEAWDVISY